jgi:ribose transport system ATP-binding protein
MGELLYAKNITKIFPGVRALDSVSIRINDGEVLGLLGENGAGKSTLLNVLSGTYKQDEGEIYLQGEKVNIETKQDALNLGIAIVYQELKLHPNLTVAENIFMGRLPKNRFGTVQYKKLYRNAQELLDFYQFDIDAKKELSALPIADCQMVEIAKSLSRNAKVILMDEPTSSLLSHEVERLFEIIKDLKEKGIGVVFISHKLEEIAKCCDRVQVLRDGKDAGMRDVVETNENELVKMMVGREITDVYPKKTNVPGDVILEVKELSRGVKVKNVSFSVRKGEVFGIAGLVGAGRSELVRLIFGADKKDAGEIYLNGKKIDIKSPSDAIRQGIFLVPEDRKLQGLVLQQDIEWNIVLPLIYKLQKILGYVDTSDSKKMAESQIKRLGIKCTSRAQKVVTLSGGNQQKVVIGKCLQTDPRIMILDDPTRGIDVGTKSEIYNLINEIACRGTAIILISSELPEVIKLSDRVAVIRDGELRAVLDSGDLSQESVIKYAIEEDIKK